MIKYFHQLSRKEFKALVAKKLTYKELAKDYPQPKWCGYPEATAGVMGCWSLMDFTCDCNRASSQAGAVREG